MAPHRLLVRFVRWPVCFVTRLPGRRAQSNHPPSEPGEPRRASPSRGSRTRRPDTRGGGHHASLYRRSIGGHRRDNRGDRETRGGEHPHCVFLFANLTRVGSISHPISPSDRPLPKSKSTKRPPTRERPRNPADVRSCSKCFRLTNPNARVSAVRTTRWCSQSPISLPGVARTHDRASTHDLVPCGARSGGRAGPGARFPSAADNTFGGHLALAKTAQKLRASLFQSGAGT